MSCSTEPLALGCPHKGGTELDAQEAKLLLKGVGDELAAVVVTHFEPAGHALAKALLALAYGRTDHLQCLIARPWPGRVDAHALTRAVVHGHKDGRHVFLERQRRRRVDPPHLVRCLRRDPPVVHARPYFIAPNCRKTAPASQ